MIEFAQPLAFLLLPLPWLAWRLLPPNPRPASLLVPGGIASHLAGLSGARDSLNRRAPAAGLVTLLVGWLALVTALAGPFSRGAELLPPSGRDLVIALDLSSSMAEEDIAASEGTASRLDVAMALVRAVLAGREGDRVALIAFAQDAYLIAPPTHDVEAIVGYLDELVVGLPGKRTDLGKVIGLAIRVLEDQPAQARVVLLLTDGEANSGDFGPADTASLAAAAGIRVHTVGVSPAGKDESLDEIARVTGGAVFDARSAEAVTEVASELDALEPVQGQDNRVWLARSWSRELLIAALVALAFHSARRLVP